MNTKHKRGLPYALIAIFSVFILAACGASEEAVPTPDDPDVQISLTLMNIEMVGSGDTVTAIATLSGLPADADDTVTWSFETKESKVSASYDSTTKSGEPVEFEISGTHDTVTITATSIFDHAISAAETFEVHNKNAQKDLVFVGTADSDAQGWDAGTYFNPYSTIEDALLGIADGNVNENAEVRLLGEDHHVDNGIDLAYPITLSGEEGNRVVITLDQGNVLSIKSDDITIKGINFELTEPSTAKIYIINADTGYPVPPGPAGHPGDPNKNLHVLGNTFQGTYDPSIKSESDYDQYGVQIWPVIEQSHGAIIKDNTFHNITRPVYIYGYKTPDTLTVTGNTAIGTKGMLFGKTSAQDMSFLNDNKFIDSSPHRSGDIVINENTTEGSPFWCTQDRADALSANNSDAFVFIVCNDPGNFKANAPIP